MALPCVGGGIEMPAGRWTLTHTQPTSMCRATAFAPIESVKDSGIRGECLADELEEFREVDRLVARVLAEVR